MTVTKTEFKMFSVKTKHKCDTDLETGKDGQNNRRGECRTEERRQLVRNVGEIRPWTAETPELMC